MVSPTERWCKVKLAIAHSLRSLAIERAQWSYQELHELQAEVEALGKTDFHTPTQRDEYELRKVQLREKELVKAQGAALRARQKWSEEGERSTKYFLGLERARKPPPGELSVLAPDGTTITGRAKVARAVRKTWSNIFAEPTAPDPKQPLALDRSPTATAAGSKFRGSWLKALSKQAAAHAQREIGMQETWPVIARLRERSSPGPDGLSAVIYKLHWHLLGPLWVDMIKEAESNGALHVDVSGGLLILLPKTDDSVRRPERQHPYHPAEC